MKEMKGRESSFVIRGNLRLVKSVTILFNISQGIARIDQKSANFSTKKIILRFFILGSLRNFEFKIFKTKTLKI